MRMRTITAEYTRPLNTLFANSLTDVGHLRVCLTIVAGVSDYHNVRAVRN